VLNFDRFHGVNTIFTVELDTNKFTTKVVTNNSPDISGWILKQKLINLVEIKQFKKASEVEEKFNIGQWVVNNESRSLMCPFLLYCFRVFDLLIIVKPKILTASA
jgi:hypothetical protein